MLLVRDDDRALAEKRTSRFCKREKESWGDARFTRQRSSEDGWMDFKSGASTRSGVGIFGRKIEFFAGEERRPLSMMCAARGMLLGGKELLGFVHVVVGCYI